LRSGSTTLLLRWIDRQQTLVELFRLIQTALELQRDRLAEQRPPLAPSDQHSSKQASAASKRFRQMAIGELQARFVAMRIELQTTSKAWRQPPTDSNGRGTTQLPLRIHVIRVAFGDHE